MARHDDEEDFDFDLGDEDFSDFEDEEEEDDLGDLNDFDDDDSSFDKSEEEEYDSDFSDLEDEEDDDDDDTEVAERKSKRAIPILGALLVLSIVGGAGFFISSNVIGNNGETIAEQTTATSTSATTSKNSTSASESKNEKPSKTSATSTANEPGSSDSESAARSFAQSFYVDGDAQKVVDIYDPDKDANVFGIQSEIDQYEATDSTFSLDKVNDTTFNITVKGKLDNGKTSTLDMSVKTIEKDSRWYITEIGLPVDKPSFV